MFKSLDKKRHVGSLTKIKILANNKICSPGCLLYYATIYLGSKYSDKISVSDVDTVFNLQKTRVQINK